jgi:hypothetical protein
VVPLYFLAKEFAGPERALPLASLGLLLPGQVLMATWLDTCYSTLAATTLWLAVTGLRGNGSRWGRPYWSGALGGLTAAFGCFLTYGFLVVGLQMTTLLALGLVLARSEARKPLVLRTAQLSVGAVMALTVCWLLLFAVHYPVAECFRKSMVIHYDFNNKRPYIPYLFLNTLDFLQSFGLPLAAISAALLGGSARGGGKLLFQKLGAFLRNTRGEELFSRESEPYTWAFWLVLAGLVISGDTRGEAARMWGLMMPLALVGFYASVGNGRLRLPCLCGGVFAQAAVLGMIAWRWAY